MKKLLLLSLTLLSLSFARAEDWLPQAIGPFLGLNNRDNSYAIPAANASDLLNVNVTPGGKSVYKRKGYAAAFTLAIATSPVHGVYTFFDSGGNTVDLYANDTRLNASVSGAQPTVLFSNGPNGATYQCTDSLGFGYCANSARTAINKTNGVTSSNLTGFVSTGTMLATAVTRLAMSGFSDRPSGIDFSADSDFTTWGTGSLGSSAAQFTINAPGSRVTHIVYAFGRLMWFKDASFGYILIGNQPFQADWVIKTVSYDVGTNDNSSVYREGILYFRGQDGHIYAFDGNNYERLSREISGTISASQSRVANSWTQTAQSDFQAGATVPAGWLSTAAFSGSIVLDSAAAISPFIDSTTANFGLASTLINIDTITYQNRISLFLSSQTIYDNYAGSDDADISTCLIGGALPPYSRLVANSTYSLTSITARLRFEGSLTAGEMTFVLKSDSSNSPGSTILSSTFSRSSITSSYADFNIPIATTTLNQGATYWVSIQDNSGGCKNSPDNIRILWANDTSFSTGSINTGGTTTNGQTLNFKALGKKFSTSGSIVSRTFDTALTTNTWLWGWSLFTANGYIPLGTTLTYETQTSSSSTGIFESLIGVSSGSAPSSSVQRFIRYKATFTTTNASTSPYLSTASITMTGRLRPSATFYSQIKNAPSLTSWDTFTANKIDNGGAQTFSIRAATNTFSVLSSTPTWSIVSSGGLPSISTGTFFQIADKISVSSYGALTNIVGPTLNDFTQNWFEGSATDKMYATYFDDRIWFSVASGTGATTNNTDLVYDMLNQTWTLYDIPSNGFLVRGNRLYFGSTSAGLIHKFGDTDNDNGSAINAYWKSKDFYGDTPFTQKEISNISVISESVANSTMTLTYVINGSSQTSYSYPQFNAYGNFILKNKNLPAGTNAFQFGAQFGNNAANQPFEVFAIQLGIRPKPWNVYP